ncbi:MAG: ATP-binding cassette domain-containing protein, partial [Hyphomicrobiales bacterium]|nr:ATP-binding cassette domain-containing protein [Hyphomicrobiales bacterium]
MRPSEARGLAKARQGAEALVERRPGADALVERQPQLSVPAAPVQARSRIVVESLVKEYHTKIGVRRVLDGISFAVRGGEKIAVLGRNGSGKSTLIRLLGGVEFPTSGAIRRGMSLSWPLALNGGISNGMTGAAGARFIARLY